MLAFWFELMPLFIVRWFAVRYCAVYPMSEALNVVNPRPGTYFKYTRHKCPECNGLGSIGCDKKDM